MKRILLLVLLLSILSLKAFAVDPPIFSIERGFYDAPFNLEISSTDSSALQLVYTMDGSNPLTSTTVFVENLPHTINIDPNNRTHNEPNTPCVVVRAAIIGDTDSSKSVTHTYLFLDRIITQSVNSPGTGWPSNSVNNNGFQIIDYGMDPDIYNSNEYGDDMDDALLAIPTISLNTGVENLFDSIIGIYVNAEEYGIEWERAMSMEIINSVYEPNFQVNGGMRIRGGSSRSPLNPKHSFRLFFRDEYGPKKLEYPLFEDEGAKKFDKIDLRTAQNYSWNKEGSDKNTFLREIFCRDAQGDMGHLYTKSRYYHLYINGMYWGLFMTAERPEAAFSATYLMGDKDDYDIVKAEKETYNSNIITTIATDGNMDLWTELWDITVNGYDDVNDYLYVLGEDDECGYRHKLVHESNLIDYMMGVFFTGDLDAPISNFSKNIIPNNFFASINRDDPDGFRYYRHDGEHTLFDLDRDRTGPYPASDGELIYSNPQYIHQKLIARPEYRMHFADRVYLHFYNNGALTVANCQERMMFRRDQIMMAIIGESARWGDSDENVNNPRTKNDHWLPEVNSILNDHFPYRQDYFMQQMITAGLFPNFLPPLYLNNGVEIDNIEITVTPGYEITLENPNQTGGEMYFTLDGTDPMMSDGSISPTAINADSISTITINHTTVIKARTKQDNDWSALHIERVHVAQDLSWLKFTEIMYHPTVIPNIDSNNLEFLEIKNTSETDTIYLTGIVFSEGIRYEFKDGEYLAPQDFYVIASSPCDLKAKCPDVEIDGKNFGRQSNGGEDLILRDYQQNDFLSVSYSDDAPWPELADGDGYSLVPTETNPTGDPNDPAYWRLSYDDDCGSPGTDDPASDSDPLSSNDTTPSTLSNALLEIYPNPIQSSFTIETENVNNQNYIIVNTIGQIVSTGQVNSSTNTIDASNWNSGIYLLKIDNYLVKLVKY